MTRVEGLRNAAFRLLETEPGTAAELVAFRILKRKLIQCSLSPVDGDAYARALLALPEEPGQ